MFCSFSWIMSFQCLISSCPLKFFPRENHPIISFFFLVFDIAITAIVKVTNCRSFSDISYMKLSLYSGSAMLFLMVVLLFATCLPDDDNKVTFTYVSVSEWKIVSVTYMMNVFVNYYFIREALWPSGVGRWIWNLEVPGSNRPPYSYQDLFSVVPS